MYDDEAPDWLGNNIYEYLEQSGRYSTYLALVKDLGYEETLRRTGSKTMFPATDEAFAAYFQEHGMNGSGPELVHGLSDAEKRYLFNSSMLNMAYLSNMLANVTSDADGLSEGTAVRRLSSATYLDSVPYVAYADMPKTEFWKRFESKGGTYLADNGDRMSVFFTPQYFSRINLTEADWNVIAKGWDMPWDPNGFYVNGIHVKGQNKDVTCKNGYLHLADGVVTPLPNMAEVITSTPEVSQFAELLDMFSFPYYDGTVHTNLANTRGFGGVRQAVFQPERLQHRPRREGGHQRLRHVALRPRVTFVRRQYGHGRDVRAYGRGHEGILGVGSRQVPFGQVPGVGQRVHHGAGRVPAEPPATLV